MEPKKQLSGGNPICGVTFLSVEFCNAENPLFLVVNPLRLDLGPMKA